MSEKRFIVFPNNVVWDNQLGEVVCRCILEGIGDAENVCQRLNELHEENQQLKNDCGILVQSNQEYRKENDKLKELIKENVFGMYEEGSLTDLEFKTIAYDDIVKLEISDESEPKVVVICKQGKKENVKSFCQMFIPFGIAYEIVEMIDDE